MSFPEDATNLLGRTSRESSKWPKTLLKHMYAFYSLQVGKGNNVKVKQVIT